MTRQSRGASRLRARTARFISAAATLGLLGAGLAAPLAPLAQAVTPAHHPAAPLPERVRATGTPLLQEAFTGATADSRFIAVGSACLTGAAPAQPGPGDHPLGGCPAAETGPVPPLDSAPLGYLRITDAGNDQSGAVLFDQALPAGNGLDVTFDQWQYGSTTPNTPADGISFFLVNGDVSLTHPGAFGGSLGYAQKLPDDNPNLGFLPGVDRGYLGVGLDVLGNYFGDWEQRGNGCSQRSPAGTSFRVPAPGANMVTVRGPGDGTTGYCFLTATTGNFTTNGPWPSTLPGKLQGPLTTLPAGVTPAEAQTLLEPSRRRVNVHLTPAPSPVLTVSVDFNDGTGSHQVLHTPVPEPVPSTYKFGFAGSTGLFTDVHLIRNVVIYTDQPLPELNLVKQPHEPLPGLLTVGTPIPYDFVVTNSGNVPIANLAVNDPKVGPVTCPVSTLAPGETVTCTATYLVTAADAAQGHVTNTAQATGTTDVGPVTSPPDTVTLPVVAPPGITLTKHVDAPEPFHVGDTVPYSYVVTNTGGSPVTALSVTDDKATGITCDSTVLAPAGSPGDSTVCHGSYVVTAADAQDGKVLNHATANGTSDGRPVTAEAQATVTVIGPSSISLTKQAGTPGPVHAGDTVTYTYTVTNTGTTTLTDVSVADDHVQNVACDHTTLLAGQAATCHGTYTVTAADEQLGHVTNTAQADSTGPLGELVQSPIAQVTLPVAGVPKLDLTKRADSAGPFHVGDTVAYTYTVTNSGMTVIDDLTVADDHISSVSCDRTTLEPGRTATCHGTYTVTAADAQAGHVTNTAHADGTDPQGQPVQSPPVEATVDVVTPVSALTIAKQADSAGPFQVGDTVHYTYTVTNSGMTVINSITVSDDHVSSVTCDQTTLTSGQSTTCHGTYTVTAADAQAGHVTNTAHADGTDPQGRPVQSAPVQATVTVGTATSSLAVTKRSDAAGTVYPGDTVTYTYTVTSTGSTTLTGLTVGDDRVRQVTCEQTTLDPGQSTTCHGTYTVTEADAQAGSVTNTAQASARDPQGQTVQSPPVELCISVAPCPPKGHDHKGGGGKGCPSRPGHHPIPPQKGGPGGELPSAGAPVAVVGLAGGGLVTLGGALFYRARRRAAAGRFVA